MLSYPKNVNRDIMHLGRHAWLWTSDEPEDADLLLINGGRQHYQNMGVSVEHQTLNALYATLNAVYASVPSL